MWEVTKSFYFDAAHMLSGTTLGAVAEEVHGHSFRAEVAVEGTPDPATGMVLDLGKAWASRPWKILLASSARKLPLLARLHALHSTAKAAVKPALIARRFSRDRPAPVA
jgi:hypothetical protein